MNEFGFELGPVRAMLFQIGAFIPRLLIALAVVIAGWLIAKVVRFAVTKALQAVSIGLVEDHLGHCVVDAARQGRHQARLLGHEGRL